MSAFFPDEPIGATAVRKGRRRGGRAKNVRNVGRCVYVCVCVCVDFDIAAAAEQRSPRLLPPSSTRIRGLPLPFGASHERARAQRGTMMAVTTETHTQGVERAPRERERGGRAGGGRRSGGAPSLCPGAVCSRVRLAQSLSCRVRRVVRSVHHW